jgi:hypothetical protein
MAQPERSAAVGVRIMELDELERRVFRIAGAGPVHDLVDHGSGERTQRAEEGEHDERVKAEREEGAAEGEHGGHDFVRG